jgi:hypothetical protein
MPSPKPLSFVIDSAGVSSTSTLPFARLLNSPSCFTDSGRLQMLRFSHLPPRAGGGFFSSQVETAGNTLKGAPMQPFDPVRTRKEAAKFVGVTTRTLRNMEARGELQRMDRRSFLRRAVPRDSRSPAVCPNGAVLAVNLIPSTKSRSFAGHG